MVKERRIERGKQKGRKDVKDTLSDLINISVMLITIALIY